MDVERAWQTVIAITLAAAGGLARLLSIKNKKKLKWSRILAELFISGFAGLMILMLARAVGISGDFIGVVAGISGWIGPKVLDVIAKVASIATGINLNRKDNK